MIDRLLKYDVSPSTYSTIDHSIAREAWMTTWEWEVHFLKQSFARISKALEILNVAS